MPMHNAQKQSKRAGAVSVGTKRKMVHQAGGVKKMKLNSGEALTKRPAQGAKMKGKKGTKKQISKLIGRRRTLHDASGKRFVEYLVRWDGHGPDRDSWVLCNDPVFKCESGKEHIKGYFNIIRANAPESFVTKMAPVLLDFNDGTPKREERNATYIKVTKQGLQGSEDSVITLQENKKKSSKVHEETSRVKKSRSSSRRLRLQPIALPSVCDEVSAKWSEIGRSRAALKAKKLSNKIQTSKAQALKTLQKKQLKKGLNKASSSKKRTSVKTKNSKPRSHIDSKVSKKSSQGKKSEASGEGYAAAVSSCSSSESGVLYSLASGDGSQLSHKRLFLDTGYELASESSVGTPDTDPEISFKNSPRKRMLLKDSIRPKSDSGCVGLELVTPATPASHPSPYRTPPSSPGGAGPSIQTPPLANRASSAMVEFVPSSPAAATYMKSIAASLQQKKKKGGGGGGSDSGSSSQQDRRVSKRQSEGVFKYKEIVVKKISGYTQILLYSQTQVKNALNPAVIHEVRQVLHNAKYDDTRVVLLSGSGTTFCSGVDLHYLTEGDPRQRAHKMADAVKELVAALINFPKPIVVAVNGPAVGLGVAMLPLCDIVYASDKATFYCPYGRLGQTPEGAASYTFPTGLGLAMANDLLLAGRRLTATQAMQAGLVSQVFWPTNVMDEVVTRVLKMAEHAASTAAAKALEPSKMLIRGPVKAKLLASNDSETAVLSERWTAPDCQMLIRSYVDAEQHLFL